MHAEAYEFVAKVAKSLDAARFWRIAEFGARNINGSARDAFTQYVPPSYYIGIDIADGPGVDFVADAATWAPSNTQPFDAVICCEVLEHAENADAIVRNAARLLRPGGLFIMTCAGPGRAAHSAVDGGPLRTGEFYRNVDRETLGLWARGFEIVLTDVAGPDLRALCLR